MELLLNLTWLALSIFLGVLLVVSRSRAEAASGKCWHRRSTAWMAYAILIALLLPAISMTDDLMAMAAPSDGEQIVRRYDVPVFGHYHPAIVGAVFHAGRDHFLVPLVCIERLETVGSFQAFILPPARDARDRAPPAAA